jgi:hypothetical protein
VPVEHLAGHAELPAELTDLGLGLAHRRHGQPEQRMFELGERREEPEDSLPLGEVVSMSAQTPTLWPGVGAETSFAANALNRNLLYLIQ